VDPSGPNGAYKLGTVTNPITDFDTNTTWAFDYLTKKWTNERKSQSHYPGTQPPEPYSIRNRPSKVDNPKCSRII